MPARRDSHLQRTGWTWPKVISLAVAIFTGAAIPAGLICWRVNRYFLHQEQLLHQTARELGHHVSEARNAFAEARAERREGLDARTDLERRLIRLEARSIP